MNSSGKWEERGCAEFGGGSTDTTAVHILTRKKGETEASKKKERKDLYRYGSFSSQKKERELFLSFSQGREEERRGSAREAYLSAAALREKDGVLF